MFRSQKCRRRSCTGLGAVFSIWLSMLLSILLLSVCAMLYFIWNVYLQAYKCMTSKKYCSKHIPGKCCPIGSLCSCCTPRMSYVGGTTPKFFCSLRSQQYLYQHSEDCGATPELTALSRPSIWLGGGLPLSNNPTPTFGSSGLRLRRFEPC